LWDGIFRARIEARGRMAGWLDNLHRWEFQGTVRMERPRSLQRAANRARRESEKSVSSLRARFDQLTSREHEVLSLVSAGMMNKQVASERGISEIMVKVHRGNVMLKMSAKSLADLVIMAEALGIRRPKK
jgi:DNA-binding NarL/FixJ family response regulator